MVRAMRWSAAMESLPALRRPRAVLVPEVLPPAWPYDAERAPSTAPREYEQSPAAVGLLLDVYG